MRTYILAPFVALLLVVGGCSSVPAPETPRERIVAAEAAYQAALATIGDMIDQGTIRKEHVPDIKAAIITARAALNAWQDAPDSRSHMTTALAAIRTLQEVLNSIAATAEPEAEPKGELA